MLAIGSQIGVIGGGLTGLSLALACQRAGQRVTLVESQTRLGGQLHTEYLPSDLSGVDGQQACVLELGAEGFVANSIAAESLARALGIEQDLVQQTTNLSFAFDGQSIRELEPGEAARLLGFQVPKSELGRGIRSLRHGSGQLISELERRIDGNVVVRRNDEVREVAFSEQRVLVSTSTAALSFDAVVVATGAHAAGKILKPLLGSAVDVLLCAKTLSSVNVSLCYPSHAFPRLAGSGFIAVGDGAVDGFRACSYASLKLPYRAPEGITVLRAFFRPEDTDMLTLTDADWQARAEHVLKRALGFDVPALSFRVGRWQDALPVHSPAFRAAVTSLETTLNDQGVYLAGSAFHGSGIDAALRSTDVAIRQLCGVNELFVAE